MNILSNKKGVSMEMGLIITFVIIILLAITMYLFLGDSAAGFRDIIRNIFG